MNFLNSRMEILNSDQIETYCEIRYPGLALDDLDDDDRLEVIDYVELIIDYATTRKCIIDNANEYMEDLIMNIGDSDDGTCARCNAPEAYCPCGLRLFEKYLDRDSMKDVLLERRKYFMAVEGLLNLEENGFDSGINEDDYYYYDGWSADEVLAGGRYHISGSDRARLIHDPDYQNNYSEYIDLIRMWQAAHEYFDSGNVESDDDYF
jgi:hypothetical protein